MPFDRRGMFLNRLTVHLSCQVNVFAFTRSARVIAALLRSPKDGFGFMQKTLLGSDRYGSCSTSYSSLLRVTWVERKHGAAGPPHMGNFTELYVMGRIGATFGGPG